MEGVRAREFVVGVTGFEGVTFVLGVFRLMLL